MAKVDIDLVKLVLQRNGLNARQTAQILEDINLEIQSANDEEKVPPVKKQFVMLVSDPDGEIDGKDLTGWVLQIPEEEPAFSVTERIYKAAYDYNASPKGKRIPVKSIGETLEVVPAKFFKEHQAWVKTKEPVLLIGANNEIPTDEIKKIRKADLMDEED